MFAFFCKLSTLIAIQYTESVLLFGSICVCTAASFRLELEGGGNLIPQQQHEGMIEKVAPVYGW